jgi:thymidylate synthase (FAD)
VKVINPLVEVYGNPHENQIKHIEKVSRLCYKSENAITETSASKMVSTLIKNKHFAMIEHGVFVLEVNDLPYTGGYLEHPYINITCTLTDRWEEPMRYIVSGSARGFIERFSENPITYASIIRYLAIDYPELFQPTIEERAEDFRLYDEWIENTGFEMKVRLLSYKEVTELTPDEKMVHHYTSVKFTTDRAICMEILRHRPASYAMTSTRYCNYANGKFGSEITVINPFYFDYIHFEGMERKIALAKKNAWAKACTTSEREYMELIRMGATPQEARSVLPNSLMAELVMTANDAEWKHFFEIRDDAKHVHPDLQRLSHPLHQMFRENNPDNFN